MPDFKFVQNPQSGKWIISAARRAQRPDSSKVTDVVCPFCAGHEKDEKEVYRVGGEVGDSNWLVRVIPNKYPFAPIHEIVIHSQDHHKNFGELPDSQAELILETFQQRYQTHQKSGQVYIFHNRGERGGESLTHPHSQITVVPENVSLEIPAAQEIDGDSLETKNFYIFCPKTSEWPDEVWVKAKRSGSLFGEITASEISDLATSISRLVRILDLRHGNDFPFNFYIYPGKSWYLRIIPRLKTLGGFEIGTGVFVNTQNPDETINFLKEHFENPDVEKIKTAHQASYKLKV